MLTESNKRNRKRKEKPARSVSILSILFLLSIAALMTRLMPLSISQYPFNNDSLTSCRISSEILGSGHLHIPSQMVGDESHVISTPLFSLVISFFSASVGSTPLHSGQLITAVLAILSVAAVFTLARVVVGDNRAALMAGLASLMMGTFVFTTGSVWPEALGISLLVLALLSFINRHSAGFRILSFLVLMTLPLVHHLVAAVAFLAFAYLVLWSWFIAATRRRFGRRNMLDLATVLIPVLWAVLYYSYVSLDRLSVLGSPMAIAVLLSSFAVLGLASVLVLSMRRHSKLTFAPIVGVGLCVLLVLDYFGYITSYTPSASEGTYMLLILSMAFIVSICWYGAEFVLENRPLYRAVQLALLLSPLTIIGYGFTRATTSLAQQIAYRTFDFLDIFVFIGVGAAIVGLGARRMRLYTSVSLLVIASLVLSFPFGYYSEQLLGVRHDSQAYEVELLGWANEHTNGSHLLSDERLSHMASSLYGFAKDASLPSHLEKGDAISSAWMCIVEDSWTSKGANDYPLGLVKISSASFAVTLESANVLYLGGPVEDHVRLFTGSGGD